MKTCSGSPNILLGPRSSEQELQPKLKMAQTFVTVLCDLGCLFDAFLLYYILVKAYWSRHFLPSPVMKVLCHFDFSPNADGLFLGLTRTESQMICCHLFDAFGLVRTQSEPAHRCYDAICWTRSDSFGLLSDSVQTISPMPVCDFRPPPFLDLYNII